MLSLTTNTHTHEFGLIGEQVTFRLTVNIDPKRSSRLPRQSLHLLAFLNRVSLRATDIKVDQTSLDLHRWLLLRNNSWIFTCGMIRPVLKREESFSQDDFR